MGQFAEQVVNGLQLGFVYALIAVGYTMVYGIIKLINFAHGDVIMVGAFVTFFGLVRGIPWPAAILTGMATCALLGVVIERLAYRPLRVKGAPRIAALITAIGVSLFLENFASLRIAFGPDHRQFPAMVTRLQWNVFGVTISSVQVLIAGVTIVLVLILQLVVYRTKIGKAMRAVALDLDAARLMGINVDRVIAFTFAIGSALAAAAGALWAAAYPQIWPYMGIPPGLKAFTAAVLGGIGSIPGALLGAVLMGQAEVLTAAYITTDFRDAVAFALLILVLLVRPAGLLGKAGPEKV
ncbi:branched-chain amino acid ABC transporter permease [Symbiobacterium thermophilum]|uniref:Branched-chain amino acid ABC transporter permease protein n=1 Tax=Symbiobacterium thermophilum (strain DSM 24528 / JCM 14929 / IAM 14863 / T) TaxID=292459 RepID=Q67R86_SYMTH|nr:branched-chain amino acid ABC transporter permease [Symbiobacterium thermophilum]BAD39807.1 branched-chain amino acid ABC transporter permease protein [Symbiobacterium thermophilum IAM 14863]